MQTGNTNQNSAQSRSGFRLHKTRGNQHDRKKTWRIINVKHHLPSHLNLPIAKRDNLELEPRSHSQTFPGKAPAPSLLPGCRCPLNFLKSFEEVSLYVVFLDLRGLPHNFLLQLPVVFFRTFPPCLPLPKQTFSTFDQQGTLLHSCSCSSNSNSVSNVVLLLLQIKEDPAHFRLKDMWCTRCKKKKTSSNALNLWLMQLHKTGIDLSSFWKFCG